MARVASTRTADSTKVTPVHSVLFCDQTDAPAYVTDSAQLDISGDIDMIALLTPRVYTAFGSIASRWLNGFGQAVFQWQFTNNQLGMTLNTTPDGATSVTAASTANLSTVIIPQKPIWLRVVRDMDNGAGGNDTMFYYAEWDGTFDEPTSWTQLGSTVTNAGVTSLYSASTPRLDIASFFNGAFGEWRCLFYRFIMKDGIDGDPVCDVKFYEMEDNTVLHYDEFDNQIVINNLVASGATRVKGRIPR